MKRRVLGIVEGKLCFLNKKKGKTNGKTRKLGGDEYTTRKAVLLFVGIAREGGFIMLD